MRPAAQPSHRWMWRSVPQTLPPPASTTTSVAVGRALPPPRGRGPGSDATLRSACTGESSHVYTPSGYTVGMNDTREYTVNGMSCGHEAAVKHEVSALEGVESSTSISRRSLSSCAVKGSTTRPSAPRSTKRRGRGAVAPERVHLDIEGMTCARARRVEKKPARRMDSAVNYATEEATVVCDPAQVEVDDLRGRLGCGYSAHLHGEATREATSTFRRLVVAVVDPHRRCSRWCRRSSSTAGSGSRSSPPRLSCSGPAGRFTGRGAQRPPRRGDDGHALSRSARSPPGAGFTVVLVAGIEAETYFEVGAVITAAHPSAATSRSGRRAGGRGTARAARARREGGARPP